MQCQVEGCARPAKCGKLCWSHYQRKRRTGTLEGKRGTLEIRHDTPPVCGHPESPHYAFGLCRPCYDKSRHSKTYPVHKKWVNENREKFNALARQHRQRTLAKDPAFYRKREFVRRYGITLEQFNAMALAQGYRCANQSCAFVMEPTARGVGKVLVVDHDHKTGKVRGLLCCSCNRALGHAREDIKRLTGLIEYIQRHEGAADVAWSD